MNYFSPLSSMLCISWTHKLFPQLCPKMQDVNVPNTTVELNAEGAECVCVPAAHSSYTQHLAGKGKILLKHKATIYITLITALTV